MPELVFKGKEYVYNHHLTVPYRPLGGGARAAGLFETHSAGFGAGPRC